MECDNIRILGLLILEDSIDIDKLQSLLSSYGNVIKTRLGLNKPVKDGKVKALMLLELVGNKNEMINLENDLSEISGLQLQSIEF